MTPHPCDGMGCNIILPFSDMDQAAILQQIRILRLLRRRRRERDEHARSLWVRPVLACREQQGEFHSLIPDLRRDPEGHLRYFRMTAHTFDHILDLIKNDIQKQGTNISRLHPLSSFFTWRLLIAVGTYTERHAILLGMLRSSLMTIVNGQ